MRHMKMARAALLSAVAMLATACVDLALEPHASVSNDAYYETVGDFEAGIVGVYNQLQGAAWYGRSLHIISDVMGEDVKLNGSANRYREFAEFRGQVVTGHDFETSLWTSVYDAINMLNLLINAEFAPPSALQSEYDQILGEAYALRGLAHFDLVKMYAQHYTFTGGASHPGVPIVLESDVTNLPSRNTVGEVYQQVISDLERGIDLMSDARNGAYMMTAEAAQALLSRVYLYMEDWSSSVAMADAVINSGNFALAEGSAYIDMFASGGSSEAIFEIMNTDTDNMGSNSLGGMYRASGYGDYLPARDLLDLMDADDLRWDLYVEDPNLVGDFASHRVNRWPTVTNTDNIPVIRLSEVYLNRAEAYARMDQDGPAQDDLNLIRQRSLPTAPDVTATGQALLDEIAIERRIELGYEGHRIHDLMRNQQDVVRVDATTSADFQAYPCDYCILPIPQPETDTNPNIAQNTGYGG